MILQVMCENMSIHYHAKKVLTALIAGISFENLSYSEIDFIAHF